MTEEQVKKYEELREHLREAECLGNVYGQHFRADVPSQIVNDFTQGVKAKAVHPSSKPVFDVIVGMILDLKKKNLEAWEKEIKKI